MALGAKPETPNHEGETPADMWLNSHGLTVAEIEFGNSFSFRNQMTNSVNRPELDDAFQTQRGILHAFTEDEVRKIDMKVHDHDDCVDGERNSGED